MNKIRHFAFVALLLASSFASFAGDNNYFVHTKFFYICSIKKACVYCESCPREVYDVKIQNRLDKKIHHVYYQYYSTLNEKVVTREGEIQGDEINKKATGKVSICVENGVHWTISRVVYDDGSSEQFQVEGPLRKFHQEADECDCNFNPKEKRY